MLEELVQLLPKFLGRKAHVRCMDHTVNLTAKGVLRPFEPTKPKQNNEGDSEQDTGPEDIGLDELYAELRDIEENGDQDKDDVEGFVEVLREMTAEEREQWHRDVQPVKSALYKASSMFPSLMSDLILFLFYSYTRVLATDPENLVQDD